jgi:chromosome partition protein MukB
MSRTHAEALVLVNWKGVFYERYLLDRHVTALEGANGAGKTTVMIAAYVVLLPDMSRLRFTNLGETGATGGDKGIWGRLGEPGRPSYAAIDFAVAGKQRLIAGVHLERKGEPSLEPTPFIVSGLNEDVRLQDLLLVAQTDIESVPELPELRENAARLGGRLQIFPSARDYFAALFDQGVTPLRLGTDEERNKLNEMLRTSMTGGISRALTSELRDFLLKEEGGLADTLQRMKGNLDACRRTRTEVQESRRLEQEIGGVFNAGQAMFIAAFLATRERADDLSRRVEEAQAAQVAAFEEQIAAQDALAATVAEFERTEARRAEIEGAVRSAQIWLARVRDALSAAGELARLVIALEAADEQAVSAATARSQATDVRSQRRDALRRAQEDYERAASGLADLQRGVEELHRRAGAYHQAVRRLHEGEKLLGVASLASSDFGALLSRTQAELAEVDSQRRDATTRLVDADEHRRRHAEVLSALRTLVAVEVPVENAASIAVDALRRYRDQVALTGRLPELGQALDEARSLAARQTRVRTEADRLSVTLSAEPAAATIRLLLEQVEGERTECEERVRSARQDLGTAERTARELERDRRDLAAREPQWRQHDSRASRLGEHWGSPVIDRASLDSARATLSERLASVRKEEEITRKSQERLIREARELLGAGGPFAPDLLRLKDKLGAELLAGAFEDVALSEAGFLEARLGPLAQALVVDDPRSAAHEAHSRGDDLTEVLLVSRDANLQELASSTTQIERNASDIIVDDGVALRVARIPERPRLGRRAREARASELRAEAEAKSLEIEAQRRERRQLEHLGLDGDALLAGHLVWLAGDPTTQLADVQNKLTETDALIERLRREVAQLAESSRALRPRIDSLRGLLSDAFLLDPPDYAARVRAFEIEHQAATAALHEVERVSRLAERVDADIAVLRSRPLEDAELDRLRHQVQELRQQRETLDAAIDAVEYVHMNTQALGWSEAPKQLADSQTLVPALETQLAASKTAKELAERVAKSAEEHYDTLTTQWHEANGRLVVAKKEHGAAATRFESFGIPSPSEGTVRVAAEEVSSLENALRVHNVRRDELISTRGGQETACREAEGRTKTAQDKLASERREAEPAVARWERLREQASKFKLLDSMSTALQSELGDVRGQVNLIQAAQTHRALLLERLRTARGSATLLTELEVLRGTSDSEFAEGVLELWLTVRDWLRRRLPAQFAEGDDPREALLRLRDQLTSLEERLTRQEDDLRGASEDVARGIDVQIRKARGQVTRLNKNLEGVSFGSIQGIRVRLQPLERMEQVLRALREGAAQELLFQEDLPIEAALDEIFRRYGGGRTGGQRLLDYREYAHLQVEIRRKAGADWEVANPTRLSTGEAIGVGAALMMVVLTEWERDATLLRGKKSHGSLRFLFLDEANRLSHDNLGVLFDLCQTLDLQLLIAAPEVARAEGNTTYRLTRYMTPEGREEVRVSGRRTRTEI